MAVPQARVADASCADLPNSETAPTASVQQADCCTASDASGLCPIIGGISVMKPVRAFLADPEGATDLATKPEAEQGTDAIQASNSTLTSYSGHDQPATQDSDAVNATDSLQTSTCHSDPMQRNIFTESLVPDSVLVKWGNVLDIVTPDSLATNCFTKTYTQYAKVQKWAAVTHA